jgi:hypothetical protein
MIGDYVKKEKKNNPNTHSTTQTTRQIMITWKDNNWKSSISTKKNDEQCKLTYLDIGQSWMIESQRGREIDRTQDCQENLSNMVEDRSKWIGNQ